MASQSTDTKGRTDAIGHAVWHWTNDDPVGAADWLWQPSGDFRDNGVGALAKATFDDDPASAVTWAVTIDNDRQREGAIERGVREWAKRSLQRPDGFKTVLLSPEQSEGS